MAKPTPQILTLQDLLLMREICLAQHIQCAELMAIYPVAALLSYGLAIKNLSQIETTLLNMMNAAGPPN